MKDGRSNLNQATAIDMTGKEFGSLTALRKGSRAKNGSWNWICECDCGNEVEIGGYELRSGRRTNCGDCIVEKDSMSQETPPEEPLEPKEETEETPNPNPESMPDQPPAAPLPTEDSPSLVGARFGDLTVIESAGEVIVDPMTSVHFWEVQCDCGGKCKVAEDKLFSGEITSCGCTEQRKPPAKTPRDFTGIKTGKLLVIEGVPWRAPGNGERLWVCVCDCGQQVLRRSSYLQNANYANCGCQKGGGVKRNAGVDLRREDLSGQIFGKLTAKEPAGRSPSGSANWLCDCECGNQIVKTSWSLKHNKNPSCKRCNTMAKKPTPQYHPIPGMEGNAPSGRPQVNAQEVFMLYQSVQDKARELQTAIDALAKKLIELIG